MADKNLNTDNRWEDDSFIEELQKREASYLNGTAKTYTLEETISRAKEAVKKVKQNNVECSRKMLGA